MSPVFCLALARGWDWRFYALPTMLHGQDPRRALSVRWAVVSLIAACATASSGMAGFGSALDGFRIFLFSVAGLFAGGVVAVSHLAIEKK
jgi:hypothetical protein